MSTNQKLLRFTSLFRTGFYFLRISLKTRNFYYIIDMSAKAVCVLKSEKVNGVIRFSQDVSNVWFNVKIIIILSLFRTGFRLHMAMFSLIILIILCKHDLMPRKRSKYFVHCETFVKSRKKSSKKFSSCSTACSKHTDRDGALVAHWSARSLKLIALERDTLPETNCQNTYLLCNLPKMSEQT